MNYLDLINLTLQELSFKTVSSFQELVKPDHKKIMAIINRVNDIVLDSSDWRFLARESVLNLPANSDRITIPDSSKVKSLFVDSEPFYYSDEYERFLNGRGFANEFAIFNKSILLKPAACDRKLKLLCITKNHAKNSSDEEIPNMSYASDVSLMPQEYAQKILVFGACLQFKSNPEHPRYKYWLGMYTDARSAMRASDELSVPKPPAFSLPRWALGFDRY